MPKKTTHNPTGFDVVPSFRRYCRDKYRETPQTTPPKTTVAKR